MEEFADEDFDPNTFDIGAYFASLLAKRNFPDEEEGAATIVEFKVERKYQPLRYSIEEITQLGELTIGFNQKIKTELFKIEDLNSKSLFFQMVPGSYEKTPDFDINRLSFVWEAKEILPVENKIKF